MNHYSSEHFKTARKALAEFWSTLESEPLDTPSKRRPSVEYAGFFGHDRYQTFTRACSKLAEISDSAAHVAYAAHHQACSELCYKSPSKNSNVLFQIAKPLSYLELECIETLWETYTEQKCPQCRQLLHHHKMDCGRRTKFEQIEATRQDTDPQKIETLQKIQQFWDVITTEAKTKNFSNSPNPKVIYDGLDWFMLKACSLLPDFEAWFAVFTAHDRAGAFFWSSYDFGVNTTPERPTFALIMRMTKPTSFLVFQQRNLVRDYLKEVKSADC